MCVCGGGGGAAWVKGGDDNQAHAGGTQVQASAGSKCVHCGGKACAHSGTDPPPPLNRAPRPQFVAGALRAAWWAPSWQVPARRRWPCCACWCLPWWMGARTPGTPTLLLAHLAALLLTCLGSSPMAAAPRSSCSAAARRQAAAGGGGGGGQAAAGGHRQAQLFGLHEATATPALSQPCT